MFSLRKIGFIVAAIALASLAGCGQYGPLYLPKPLPRDTAAGSARNTTQDNAQREVQRKPQDDTQDSDFNAQPPALDKSRQP